jgi:hypothetical protein
MATTDFTTGTVITSDWCNDVDQGIYQANAGITGSTARTLTDKLSDIISVKDFGAIGNGVNDDTAEINAALAAGAGGIVEFPEGNYLISGTLTVPKGTMMKGVGTCDIRDPLAVGTNISITHTATVGVLLGRGAGVDGINFWYPDQVTTSPPTAYGYTIELDNSDTAFEGGNNAGSNIHNVVIHNAYNGINLNGDPTDAAPVYGIISIHNLRMFALNLGIRSGAINSECFISDSVFSPVVWDASDGTACRQWAMTDGVACIQLMSQQGVQISNIVTFGHRRGIYCYGGGDTTLGTLEFLNVTGSIFDGHRRCVEVAGNNSLNGAMFSGCQFLSSDPANSGYTDGYCFLSDDSPKIQNVTFNGCQFFGSEGSHVYITGTTSTEVQQFLFNGCTFLSANKNNAAGTYYNIYFDHAYGQLSVLGCYILNVYASTVTNIKVANATHFMVDGLQNQDVAGKPFDLGTITVSQIIGNIVARSSTASTWAANSAVVASATTLVLPEVTSNFYEVTGTTGITSIRVSWPGRFVALKFNDVLTVTDGSNLKLAGNFTTSADDILTVVCDGTNWYEVSRSAN